MKRKFPALIALSIAFGATAAAQSVDLHLSVQDTLPVVQTFTPGEPDTRMDAIQEAVDELQAKVEQQRKASVGAISSLNKRLNALDEALSDVRNQMGKEVSSELDSLGASMSELRSLLEENAERGKATAAAYEKAVRFLRWILLLVGLLLITSVILLFKVFRKSPSVPETEPVKPVAVPETPSAAPVKAETPVTAPIPPEEPVETEPSPADIQAYQDAVNAFAGINDYINDLRKHNKLITPLIAYFAGKTDRKPDIRLDGLNEQQRSDIVLLISKIDQFHTNCIPAINRYLRLSGTGLDYAGCVRFPLNEGFSNELDTNATGDATEDGTTVLKVFKLGFLFPSVRQHPYREKSWVVV